MTFAGGSLRLTDDRIHQAPLVIMTGHDKDITVGRALSRGGPLSEGVYCDGTDGVAEVYH